MNNAQLSRRRAVRRLVSLPVAVFVLCGCDRHATEPSGERTRLDPAWLSGEASRSIDESTGEFVLRAVMPRYISQLAAETAGVAISRDIGSRFEFTELRRFLEERRGTRIDFHALRACARTTYASGSLADLPARVPGYLRRAWAPYWAVPLCDATFDEPQLSVGVPDAPRDFRVEGDTIVRTRVIGGGNNWYSTGLSPRLFSRGLALTPERAVKAVFDATGVRVSSVPEAFLQQDDSTEALITSVCASWRIALASPVLVREQRSGAERTVTEMFVKRAPFCVSDTIALYVAAEQQPAFRWISFPKDTLASAPNPMDSVAVPLVGPRRFEAITVQRR